MALHSEATVSFIIFGEKRENLLSSYLSSIFCPETNTGFVGDQGNSRPLVHKLSRVPETLVCLVDRLSEAK